MQANCDLMLSSRDASVCVHFGLDCITAERFEILSFEEVMSTDCCNLLGKEFHFMTGDEYKIFVDAVEKGLPFFFAS